MQPFIRIPSDSTPEITFDADKNLFEIKGESRPENAKAFYDPVIEWIKNFCVHSIVNQPKAKIVFTVFFEYFSSSTAKYLMNVLGRFEELHKHNIPVVIRWVYNNNDIEMKEAGEEFEKLLNVPFTFEIIN